MGALLRHFARPDKGGDKPRPYECPNAASLWNPSITCRQGVLGFESQIEDNSDYGESGDRVIARNSWGNPRLCGNPRSGADAD